MRALNVIMLQNPILFGIVRISRTFQDYVTFLPFQFDSEFDAAENGCSDSFGGCKQHQPLTGPPFLDQKDNESSEKSV